MLIALDTETYPVRPGLLAPPLVCASYAWSTAHCGIMPRTRALEIIREYLEGDDMLVGANIAYDMAVVMAADPRLVRLVLAKYARGEVYDVQVGQALDAIANGHLFVDPRTGGALYDPMTGELKGRYSLGVCADLTLGHKLAKRLDLWATRYGELWELYGEDLAKYPPEAREYPVNDAVETFMTAEAHLGLRPWADGKVRVIRNFEGVDREVRAALALHLGACWGLRTDGATVAEVREAAEAAHRTYVERFAAQGFLREVKGVWKEDGARVRREIAVAYGADPRSTCKACNGVGRRRSTVSGNLVGCGPRSFAGEDWCDGTGLDLSRDCGAVPRTPGGGISTNRDALLESGDATLAEYGADEEEKVRTTYAPFLAAGAEVPLNFRPNVTVESFRSSYDGVINQMPRGGRCRECFVARPGYVLCSCDYSGIELCTLAQQCIRLVGWSRMAEVINESGDPGGLHAAFGAQMMGVSVAEFKAKIKAKDKLAADFRQAAKAANFGFPGGMAEYKLVLAKRKKSEGKTRAPDGTVYHGIRFCILLGGAERCGVEKVTEWRGKAGPPACKACIIEAGRLRQQWFEAFPEIPKYFEVVGRTVDDLGEIEVWPGTGTVRGGVGFCDGANGYFQGLAAVGMKHALWDITTECLDPQSPLWGGHLAFGVHDESITELPEPTAHPAAYRQAELMVAAMRREATPDITGIKVEPALMRRWYKGAETVLKDGVLVPWEPEVEQ